MSIQSDHKALIFIAMVAVLGAGVRVLRAAGRGVAPVVQPALERQALAADSAARSGRGGKGRGRRGTGPARAPKDSVHGPQVADALVGLPRGGPDRPGYLHGKLDLDVATAAQLDSLPGITPAVAKRIVADRLGRGPFLNREGLRRVIGVGPSVLARIDSMVTYSGTYARPVVSDTVIPPRGASRGKRGRPSPAPTDRDVESEPG